MCQDPDDGVRDTPELQYSAERAETDKRETDDERFQREAEEEVDALLDQWNEGRT